MMIGYKQTEVGVIPKEWELKRLNEVADLQVGFAFKSDWFGKYIGPRLLRGENVGYGAANWSDTRTLEGKKEAEFNSYLLSAGEVVIAMDRTFTKSGSKITLISQDDCPCLLVQRVGRFVSLKCDKRFLWFVLTSETVKSRLRLEQKGMDIPHLSRSEILHPFAIFPPLTEQRAIAAALSEVDELLDSLDRLIVKKRDLKQAAMQQLLTGQIRLPGFSREWVVKRLGAISELYQPETISQSEFTDHGYPVFGANGIVGMYDRFNHQSPQITISCRGNCGTVNRTQGPSWITGNAMVVNLDETPDIDKSFIYYYLAFADLSILVTGSGIPQIVRDPLANFELSIPKDFKEQLAISNVLSAIDQELEMLEQRRNKTSALKQGMMQELLTGRTRLV